MFIQYDKKSMIGRALGPGNFTIFGCSIGPVTGQLQNQPDIVLKHKVLEKKEGAF